MFRGTYDVYFPVGDVITIILCLVNAFLLQSTYTVEKKNIKLFHFANSLTILASSCSIFYHEWLYRPNEHSVVILYILGDIMYLALALDFVLFIKYILNLIRIDDKQRKTIEKFIGAIYVIYAIIHIISPVIGGKLDIHTESKTEGFHMISLFIIYYILCAAFVLYLLVKYKRRFISKVRKCILEIVLLTFSIFFLQIYFEQTSYTCLSFVIPIIAVLFLFHYNAYDIDSGTLDLKSFNAYIKELRGKKFGMLSVEFSDFSTRVMESLEKYFFHFNEKFFKDCCTFRITNSKMILIFEESKNSNIPEIMEKMMQEFNELYQEYQIEYKIVYVPVRDKQLAEEEYLDIIFNLEKGMNWNEFKVCQKEDIDDYIRFKIIKRTLKDISDIGNLDDERVKVFCQPVFNTKEGEFNTAEALMRLEIPEMGMIFPDEFIPIAERYNFIHSLSLIILHKTCKEIINIENNGYKIERVSVNFSMIELRGTNFCDDVIKVINATGIDSDKIAIELTESKNEQDYELVKNVMAKLHNFGIKFYLDDFGTGYSNFERIIGLPIDIVKFDRSLTIMAGKDEQSRYMVGRFSDIFDNSHYQVLFEGVEDEADETRCKDMNALYLQGYKYSKPIPIENLCEFLEKK